MVAPGGSELVVLGAVVLVRDAPLRLDEPLPFEPMESLVERRVLDGELTGATLRDPLRDSVAVHRRPGERAQDQDIDGALEQAQLFACHEVSLRYCTSRGEYITM